MRVSSGMLRSIFSPAHYSTQTRISNNQCVSWHLCHTLAYVICTWLSVPSVIKIGFIQINIFVINFKT